MSSELPEPERPEQRVIVASQLRLDIRRFLGAGILLVLLYALHRFLGISIPTRLLGSSLLGLLVGLIGGYRLYKPVYIIELDTREFPEELGIKIVPKAKYKPPRPPEGYPFKTISRAGSDVVVITKIPYPEPTELKATLKGYQDLIKKYEEALHRLRKLELELEVKSLNQARKVLKDYLEAKKALREARKEEK